jgi:hypothetical protein
MLKGLSSKKQQQEKNCSSPIQGSLQRSFQGQEKILFLGRTIGAFFSSIRTDKAEPDI